MKDTLPFARFVLELKYDVLCHYVIKTPSWNLYVTKHIAWSKCRTVGVQRLGSWQNIASKAKGRVLGMYTHHGNYCLS